MVKIWYQVQTPTGCFGFSSTNRIVKDFPEYKWNGGTLESLKVWFAGTGYKCYKICEQLLP